MLIVGHRGSSVKAPENTPASFRLAWREGADAVELDIHATQDGQAVVIHDRTTRRTTGIRARVKELPLSTLHDMDAGRWKDIRWMGETIPSLRDVLMETPAKKKVIVEIKSGPDAIEPLVNLLNELQWNSARMILVGFSLKALRRARTQLPGYEILLNVTHRRLRASGIRHLIESVEKAGLQGLGLEDGPRVNGTVLATIRNAGQKIFVWTVNESTRARQMQEWGADYLATDDPGRIRAALKA